MVGYPMGQAPGPYAHGSAQPPSPSSGGYTNPPQHIPGSAPPQAPPPMAPSAPAPPGNAGPAARCANWKCPCDSWDGRLGEFCCNTCRKGTLCKTRTHVFIQPGAPGMCDQCRQYPSQPALRICQYCTANNIPRLRQSVQQIRPGQYIDFYNQHEDFYEFTNFYPVELTIDGKTYPTSEHYFQAAKFLHTAPQVAEMIRLAPRPRGAFDIAHQYHQQERPDWMQVREQVMGYVLSVKFQNPYLREVLLLTGNYPLREHTVNDKYWGDGGDGSGQNRLGQLLELTRAQLQLQQPQPSTHQPPVANSPASSNQQAYPGASYNSRQQQQPPQPAPQQAQQQWAGAAIGNGAQQQSIYQHQHQQYAQQPPPQPQQQQQPLSGPPRGAQLLPPQPPPGSFGSGLTGPL
jgi:ribA/ribD-fused uncharacterized protein